MEATLFTRLGVASSKQQLAMSSLKRVRPLTTRATRLATCVLPRTEFSNRFAISIPRAAHITASGIPRRSQSTATTRDDSTQPRRPSSFSQKLPDPERPPQRHSTFDVAGRVYIVTGGAQGLGLCMAEALAENGAHVYCLDRAATPSESFHSSHSVISASSSGTMTYQQVDVTDASGLDTIVSSIAANHNRLDGLAAAAGIQYVSPALDYPPDKIDEMLAVNYKGVYLSAVSCARQMIQHQTPGSLLLVGSTSGMNAIKGFTASVYCGAKAGVIQMARSLAMEWGKVVNGRSIRVNALCPGNIMTPMVRKNFQDDPQLKAIWERENMMGRLSEPEEYKGATLFLLSDASSFMTGASLVIDGGYTAW